jgi:uncharacterized protein HemX
MDPINNNQMNSMYQSPLVQQPKHKTSVVSVIVLLLIASIVAVLGFGRVNTIKEEADKLELQNAKTSQEMESKTKAMEEKKKAEANILSDLDAINIESNASDIAEIDAAF